MKPIQTAEIARAIANIATARGNASTVPLAAELVERITEMFREQLAKSNVKIDVRFVDNDAVGKAIRPRVVELLDAAESGLADAALPKRFHDKIARVKAHLLARDEFDGIDAVARLEELMYDLLGELTEPQFLRISIEKRPFYEQAEPLFGPSVTNKFPNSARDIAAAGRCFAFGEWTACVSHLMRALETPLQVFANRVGVAFPGPTDLENWKTIVDQMESKVTADVKRLEGTPKGHARNEELQFLGDIALDFRHFKNAWRNDVAHGREWYDEHEADRVYNAVKHFMQRMAEIA